LLPVGYFHLVFTLPSPIADIAYQNKAVIYDLLFKAARDHDHDRRRPQASRRQDRHHCRAAYLGLGDDAPPPRTHDRAGWRDLGRRITMGLVPIELFPARAGALAPVPAAVSSDAQRRAYSWPPEVPRRSRRTRATFAALLAPLRKTEWVV
jgi:hypothetical protein